MYCIPMHEIISVYLFTMLFYLLSIARHSFLGVQTKTRSSNSSTTHSLKSHNPETLMSSVVIGFVHAICKHSRKVPRTKSGTG